MAVPAIAIMALVEQGLRIVSRLHRLSQDAAAGTEVSDAELRLAQQSRQQTDDEFERILEQMRNKEG